MMTGSKLAKVSFTVMAACALAAAQDGVTSPTAPRTGIYAGVTRFNAAADNTVDDYTRRPTLINGKQYFAGWGGADLLNGAFSFNGGGYDWFGSAMGGETPDDIRAGLAVGGAWGAGVMLSLAKHDFDNGTDDQATLEGDGIGVFGNLALGGSDVYGQLAWFTGYGSLAGGSDHFREVGSLENSNNLINFLAGWKKDATTEGTHALNAELVVNYSMKDDEIVANERSQTLVDAWFYHGYILRSTPGYSVFLGSNSQIMYFMEDVEADGAADPSQFRLAVTPNIAFQKTLAWGFETFAGAGVTLGWDLYSDMVPGTAPAGLVPGDAEGQTDLLTRDTDVTLGLRWVKDNLAVEGSIREGILSNGPHFIGGNGAPGLMAEVGVTLGI